MLASDRLEPNSHRSARDRFGEYPMRAIDDQGSNILGSSHDLKEKEDDTSR